MGGMYEELRAALHAVWTRRWIALAVAWVLCLLGWLVVSQIPNQYETSARILVETNDMLQGDSALTPMQQSRQMDRIRQTLTSAVNLEKVVRGTDLSKSVTSDADVAQKVAALQNMITVTQQQDNLFKLSATVAQGSDAESAKLSYQIVKKLIDVFVSDNLSADREDTAQRLDFLNDQLDQRQKQLQVAEQKVADFQNQYLGSLPGTGSLSERIATARSQLSGVEQDLAAARSSLSSTNAQMASTSPTVASAGGGNAGPARTRVATIEAQLAEARSRGWTDQHPDVIALKSQLAQAKQAAKNEPAYAAGGSPNPLYMQLQSMQADKQSRVAELTQRRDQLQSDLDQLQNKLSGDPSAAADQAQTERNLQVLQDQYNKLLSDRENAKLQSQAQSATDSMEFNVVDPPTAPRVPSAPNRPLLLTGVLIVGIAGGIGVAFALSRLRTTFATAGRLESASGMPVIGSIGQVVTRAQTDLRAKRMKLFYGGAGALAFAYVALLGVEFVQRGMVGA